MYKIKLNSIECKNVRNKEIKIRWNKYIEYEMLAKKLPMVEIVLLSSNLLKRASVIANEQEHIGKKTNCVN